MWSLEHPKTHRPNGDDREDASVLVTRSTEVTERLAGYDLLTTLCLVQDKRRGPLGRTLELGNKETRQMTGKTGQNQPSERLPVQN